ncbi:hypothetical protein AMAG_09245 [Allomyces macrogynus ATCC 38327]|uniref:NADPH--hemoprotein reductase n=1 Tax=Allomyces macrogynus (strain ATCC 38327) TaxID=578462 RepID=A0A0L0SNV3_ALLM3|nr:hypothetical protein AMAG_09245 [Allomyces macrogynus ATCC 38327]|eukprot:KNE64201.1 hypothetical protein AMAG_09245 [Allomyces macrogynus ATCC 38327]
MAPPPVAAPAADTAPAPAPSKRTPSSASPGPRAPASGAPRTAPRTVHLAFDGVPAPVPLLVDPALTEVEVRAAIVAALQLPTHEFYVADSADRVILDLVPKNLTKFESVRVRVGHVATRAEPGPKPRPLVGNVHQLGADFLSPLRQFTNEYGSIFKLKLFQQVAHVTCSADAAAQVMFESPFFTKRVTGALLELKPVGGDGLFTTDTDNPTWALAHKLLSPGFGATPLKQYLPEINVGAGKLCGVLDKMDGKEFNVAEWMTRFTFQTIGQCGFGFDFGVLDAPDAPLHPFVDAMNFCLNESKVRSGSTRFYKMLPITSNAQFKKSLDLMRRTVDQVLSVRKAALIRSDPAATIKRDLLNYMLTACDESGTSLPDENIRDQILTFLIAGHETTSNLLAWCLWLLTQHPLIEAKLLAEAVSVCGTDPSVPITAAQMAQLTYTTAVLKETLRLYPPVPIIMKRCEMDTVLEGVPVSAGEDVFVNVVQLHRNRAIWGPYAEVFHPEHFMSKEAEAKRHKFAWVPFSMGERSCIGMAFAMMEAKVLLATLVRKYLFEYRHHEPATYDPSALTLKPLNLRLTVHRRDPATLPTAAAFAPGATDRSASPTTPASKPITLQPALTTPSLSLPGLIIAYASNMGTSEAFALALAQTAESSYRVPVQVMTLDAWADVARKDKRKLHVIVTSTYNGGPPDNAVRAAKWLKQSHELKGLKFAVFGCGNSQWRTFQQFPRFVAERLTAMGATAVGEIGGGDADGDIDFAFAQWEAAWWLDVQRAYQLAAPSSPLITAAPIIPTTSTNSLPRGTNLTVEFTDLDPTIPGEIAPPPQFSTSPSLVALPSPPMPTPVASVVAPSSPPVQPKPAPTKSLAAPTVHNQSVSSPVSLTTLIAAPVVDAGIQRMVDESNQYHSAHCIMMVHDKSVPADVQFLAESDDETKTRANRAPPHMVHATVVTNRELLRPLPGVDGCDANKSTRYIELRVPDGTVYRAGDHFDVWPEEKADDVARVAAHLALDLDAVFKLTGGARAPKTAAAAVGQDEPCTVRAALTYLVDLQGAPPRPLVEHVLALQGRHDDAARVRHQDPALYRTWCAQRKRTLDTILAAPAGALALVDLLTTAAGVVPRRYSIASSPLVDATRVALLVGVTPDGYCSAYLARSEVGARLYVQVKPGRDVFRLPDDNARAVMMVGAGTGLAPYLGFLEDRRARNVTSPAHLFFGCRHAEHDRLFKEELDGYVASGHLTAVHAAYSRDASAQWKYVQDALTAHGDVLVGAMVEGKAPLFVCGSAKGMARDVFCTVSAIFTEKLGVDSDAYLEELQQRGQYVEDTWG